MIFARICDDKEKPLVTTGSAALRGYEGKDGWFPVESFNFGLQAEEKDKGGSGASDPKGGHSEPPKKGGTGPAKGGGKQDFAAVKLAKHVDMSSCALMVQAMKERGHK